jgi:hypothetical protein
MGSEEIETLRGSLVPAVARRVRNMILCAYPTAWALPRAQACLSMHRRSGRDALLSLVASIERLVRLAAGLDGLEEGIDTLVVIPDILGPSCHLRACVFAKKMLNQPERHVHACGYP